MLVVREVEQFDSPALRGLGRDEMLRLIGQGVAQVDVLLGLLHKNCCWLPSTIGSTPRRRVAKPKANHKSLPDGAKSTALSEIRGALA